MKDLLNKDAKLANDVGKIMFVALLRYAFNDRRNMQGKKMDDFSLQM